MVQNRGGSARGCRAGTEGRMIKAGPAKLVLLDWGKAAAGKYPPWLPGTCHRRKIMVQWPQAFAVPKGGAGDGFPESPSGAALRYAAALSAIQKTE